jgi:hypothetical protein
MDDHGIREFKLGDKQKKEKIEMGQVVPYCRREVFGYKQSFTNLEIQLKDVSKKMEKCCRDMGYPQLEKHMGSDMDELNNSMCYKGKTYKN